MIIVFLAPVLILYLVVFLYPVLQTAIMSFFKVRTIDQPFSEWSFNGFDNYKALFNRPIFNTAMVNMLKMWFVGGVGVLLLALIFAVILTGGIRGKRFWRSAIYLPNVISAVAMGSMWVFYILNSQYGLLNKVITFFGGKAVDWLGPGTGFWSMVIAFCFGMVGYHMLIFISGIEKIGTEYYEAATIDGANAFQKFFKITLPLIKGVIRSNIVIWTVAISGFYVWSVLFSPLQITNDTATPVRYMYIIVFGGMGQSVEPRDAGAGAGVGILMALMVVIVSLATKLITRHDDVEL